MSCTSQTANMSQETNEGIMVYCKTITAKFLAIVHCLVETIIIHAKPKAYLEAYISACQPFLTVTYIKPVISLYIYRFLSFSSILISNRYWWSTVFNYVVNSAGCCLGRNRSGEINWTSSRNCLSFIYIIKGSCVLCWCHSL